MKYYEVCIYSSDLSERNIAEVEVERETKKCIWIDGRKCNKKSDWKCYVKTREEALDLIREAIENNISKQEETIKYSQDYLVELNENLKHIEELCQKKKR